MADSVYKQIVDALMARLAGDGTATPPPGIDAGSITKNRTTRIDSRKLPTYSVYFVKHAEPQAVGLRYSPTVMNRTGMVEIRALVQGDDDDLDPHMQWITQQMASAGRLVHPGFAQGLIKGVIEGESMTGPLEGAEGKVIEWTSRWYVEFTTLPADITKTGRS